MGKGTIDPRPQTALCSWYADFRRGSSRGLQQMGQRACDDPDERSPSTPQERSGHGSATYG